MNLRRLKNSITGRFLLHDLRLFAIIAIVGLAVFSGYTVYIDNLYFQLDDNLLDHVVDDTLSVGATAAVKKNPVPPGTYVEHLSGDLRVLDNSDQSPRYVGYQYTAEELNDVNLSPFMSAYQYYLADDGESVIVAVPFSDYVGSGLPEVLFVCIFLLLTAIATFVHSYRTAKDMTEPVDAIAKGVNQIAQGAYGTTFQVEGDKELVQLADQISQLSSTVAHEISLREAEEEKRKQLILDISHDLRTPLTNIRGYAETLDQGHLNEDQMKDSIQVILKNSQRADQLIHSLFELSRLNSTHSPLEAQEENIAELLRQFFADHMKSLEDQNHPYDLDIPETPVVAMVDVLLFRRALDNLFTNFLQHSGPGTTFGLGLEVKDQAGRILIWDDGVGIPEDMHETVFSSFTRLDQARRQDTGGAGLGLAITKKIIDQHGGNIGLRPVTRGTCFEIILPLVNKD